MFSPLLQDLRYVTRILLKQPGFAAIAVLTLALGIGANTAIFSVVDAVLLRPLPYHDSDRLIDIFSSSPSGGRDEISVAEWQDLRAQMRSVTDLAAVQSQSVNLTGGDRPTRVRGAFVSANFFEVFQLRPIVGRTFVEGEDGRGGPKVAVINEKLWRERLHGDPNLEDKKLLLNGEPYSVIGVITSEFETPFDRDVQVWLGYAQYPGVPVTRDARYLIPLGYLTPGVSLAQAQAEASTIASQFAAAYPKESAGRGLRINPYREFVVGQIRPMLILLFVAAAAILLIACANLANLLLARGLTRQREIAIRAALGASRSRLVRQLLTETTLLSLLGGIGGVLLANWGVWALLRLPQNFIRAQNVSVDARVLIFALLTSLVTGWLFGLTPSLQLTRAGLQEGLQQGGRGAGSGAHGNRMRGAFVIVQIAFSIMLLIAAGLLIRSFGKLWQAGLGFDSKNLLTLEYRLPRAKYGEDATWNFHRRVIDEVGVLVDVALAADVGDRDRRRRQRRAHSQCGHAAAAPTRPS
jgi:putative ABC transport system permease protein